MENTLELSIDGMHCGACVRRVNNSLAGLEGVQIGSVAVGSAAITFDPAAMSPDKIIEAVENAGFTVRKEQ
jgi:copper chaperone